MTRGRHGWLLASALLLACDDAGGGAANDSDAPPRTPGIVSDGESTGPGSGSAGSRAEGPIAGGEQKPPAVDGPIGVRAPDPGTRTGNPEAPPGAEVLAPPASIDPTPDVSVDARAQLGRDNRAFALELYARVVLDDQGMDNGENQFFSPYGISQVLAIAYAGANGETEREMASALHFALPEPGLHAAFNAANLELAKRASEVSPESMGDGVQLMLTNALFLQRDFELLPSYMEVLGVNYGIDLYAFDFKANPDRARTSINGWVEDRTAKRISGLLPDGSITGETRLVAVNTVYFKAPWLTPFAKEATADGTFHALDGDVTAKLMHGSGMRYMKGDGFVATELPYLSPSLRMLVVLPDAGRFAEVQARFDGAAVDAALAALADGYAVRVTMPKFQFVTTLPLGKLLADAGMRLAFRDGGADFSGMRAERDLYISDVAHKAFIAVDEEGSEAAAATAVVGSGTTSVPPTPEVVEVVLTRPFMFAIYDEPTGQFLFLGRVMNPTQ